MGWLAEAPTGDGAPGRPGPLGRLHGVARLVPALVAALVLAGWRAEARAQATTVRVEGGELAGAPVRDGVQAFKGVPYAAAPVGALRWRAPAAVEPWSGVRRTDRFGANCAQRKTFGDIDPYSPAMSEDCLYLNVWAPAARTGRPLPVMVWIHGGGLVAGSGSEPRHDGVALARKGVVLVTLNYRLGVFGFLASPGLSAEAGGRGSGDWGLMDQIAALKWVQRNIAAFGGDPRRVTIFGESAGSWSVSALTASPLARGLFQRAIGESGAAFPSDTPGVLPLAEAEAMGAQLLKTVKATSPAEARALTTGQLLDAEEGRSWRPNVDGAVLPSPPAELFASGRANPVPLLAGSNSDERFWPAAYAGVGYRDTLAGVFGAELAAKVAAAYPADLDEARRRFGGDAVIGYPTWAWAAAMRKTGRPTWLYLFDRKPGAPPGVTGQAYHSADIAYVFDHPAVSGGDQPQDRRVADVMSQYWVNFARSGDPNGPGLPPWPTYTSGDSSAERMVFGDMIAARPDPLLPRYEVLNQAFSAAAARTPAAAPAP